MAEEYNPTKLDKELQAADIPIEGCSSDGRIDFLPEATPEQIAEADTIKAAHDPTDTTQQDFEAARGRLAIAQMQELKNNLAMGGVPTQAENLAELTQIVSDLMIVLLGYDNDPAQP